MKDQYFGDVNDYRKYGLLRVLAREAKIRIAVCWMLTESDGRSDGRFTEYLGQPENWEALDPELFRFLHRTVVVEGVRSVATIEGSSLLPDARFWSPLLPDDAGGRGIWFDRFWRHAAGSDLVFFDPDNGLEVPSKRRGARDSNKYVYWSEVEEAAVRGHSVLAYQHFPRVKRGPYIEQKARAMGRRCGSSTVLAFRTAHVVFLLAPQRAHEAALLTAADEVGRRWAGQITVSSFTV